MNTLFERVYCFFFYVVFGVALNIFGGDVITLDAMALAYSELNPISASH
jgi:hypothetical protein